jgi:hypothetical protein
MTNEIQHILSGTSQVKHYYLIQTTCSYLKGSQGASAMDKNQQQRKEGAEQNVYLKDWSTVLTLNDSSYCTKGSV